MRAGGGPLAFLGHRRSASVVRARVRRGLFVGAGLAVAAALPGGVAVALARPSVEQGTALAGRGLVAARAADQAGAAAELADAEVRFADARSSLGAWWARPARLVPVVGQHVAALHAAATSGYDLATAGRRLATATDLNGVRIEDGRLPLGPIEEIRSPLSSAAALVSASVDRLRAVRSAWLVPPVARRLDDNLVRLRSTERTLTTSSRLIDALPGMLGAGGERRWFLAVQTPSESRATGGFIGNYGEITAADGVLDLARFGRIGDLGVVDGSPDRTLSGPQDYLSRYGRFGVAETWQSVNLSPDFPSVAQVVAGLYPQSGGRPVDGMVAIDPTGIAAFLRLTGPIEVPSWPEPLTADNAERILLYDQYVRFGELADRVNFLGDATEILWRRVTSGSLPPTKTILDVLGPVVEGKHLLVASLEPGEAEALAGTGLDGSLRDVDGDYLATITQNASGNKIDWFLHRTVDYRVRLDPASATIRADLHVELRNDAPSSGMPDYLIGNLTTPRMPRGTNRTYVSIYTPWSLEAATVGGTATAMESEVERGRRVYSAFVEIPPGGTVALDLRLRGRLRLGARRPYRLDLQAQPVVNPDRVRVEVSSPGREPLLRTLAGPGDQQVVTPAG